MNTVASLAAGLTYGATEVKFGLFIGKLTRRILVRTAIILGLVHEGSKALANHGIFRKKEGGIDPSLPTDPFNDPSWENISHPDAAEAGHHKFKNRKTGDVVEYDKGKAGKPGHRGRDHYHRPNPESTGDKDKYLNDQGEPVSDGHEQSHLYPRE